MEFVKPHSTCCMLCFEVLCQRTCHPIQDKLLACVTGVSIAAGRSPYSELVRLAIKPATNIANFWIQSTPQQRRDASVFLAVGSQVLLPLCNPCHNEPCIRIAMTLLDQTVVGLSRAGRNLHWIACTRPAHACLLQGGVSNLRKL